MGSIVHRSVPTNLKWFPTCSHAHALFQDRFKDVQVSSRWFSTLYILSPNFHIPSWTVVLYTEVPIDYHTVCRVSFHHEVFTCRRLGSSDKSRILYRYGGHGVPFSWI